MPGYEPERKPGAFNHASRRRLLEGTVTDFLSEVTRFNCRQGRWVERLSILAGAVAMQLLLTAAAYADLLVGNSNTSNFSNCTGCSSSSATSLGLSTFTLGITTPFAFDVTANQTGVPLAQLEMITGNNPTGTANFDYNVILTFTTPTDSFTDTIPLTATAGPGNGTNSSETLSGFPSLADFSLPGVTLSNFAFVTAGGSAGGNTFSGGNWSVTRGPGGPGGTAFLDLVANVTAAAANVPEPASLTVLGAALGALVGSSLIRRRAKGHAALNFPDRHTDIKARKSAVQ